MQVGDRVRYTAKAKKFPGVCVDSTGRDLHLASPMLYPFPMASDMTGVVVAEVKRPAGPITSAGMLVTVDWEWKGHHHESTMHPSWLERVEVRDKLVAALEKQFGPLDE